MVGRVYLQRIKALRKVKRMTQADVADKMKIDYSTYGKIENGITDLTVDRAYELAHILEVDISKILYVGDLEFNDWITETVVSEPMENYGRKTPTNIIFQIGGEGTNSASADRFLQRLGRLLLESESESPGQQGDKK